MNEIETLKRRIEELEKFVKQLQMSHSIPLSVDQAFRKRFFNESSLTSSGKSATSENQSVNENGVATYDVLKPPDAFIQVSISGTTYYIPVFT